MLTLSWPPTSQTVKLMFLYSTVSTLNPAKFQDKPILSMRLHYSKSIPCMNGQQMYYFIFTKFLYTHNAPEKMAYYSEVHFVKFSSYYPNNTFLHENDVTQESNIQEPGYNFVNFYSSSHYR
jgi:hypothetical protein